MPDVAAIAKRVALALLTTAALCAARAIYSVNSGDGPAVELMLQREIERHTKP